MGSGCWRPSWSWLLQLPLQDASLLDRGTGAESHQGVEHLLQACDPRVTSPHSSKDPPVKDQRIAFQHLVLHLPAHNRPGPLTKMPH